MIPRFMRSDKVDYEGELGVVIGRPCKNVRPEEALSMFWAIPVQMTLVLGTGRKKKGEDSFAGVRVLILFVRWVHALQLLMKFRILPNSCCELLLMRKKCRNLQPEI